MIVHRDVQQGSEEWLRLRLGIPTSSCFDRVVTASGKVSSQCTHYMHALLAEWLTGAPLDSFQSPYMQRGNDLEAKAVISYEFERSCETETVGFITTDDGMLGTSPDRLVGSDGILEIKCPAIHTHVGYMLNLNVDKAYWPQVQGQLLISGRQWVDIQSYYPGLPTVIIRVQRDVRYLALMSVALTVFVDALKDARSKLESTYGRFVLPSAPQEQVERFGITDEDIELIYGYPTR